MQKKLIILLITIVLLIPITVEARKQISMPFEELLFHDYDINLTYDVHEYYVTVENEITKLSMATENKCENDELCINEAFLNYFLRNTGSFIYNNKLISSRGSIMSPDSYDEEIEDKNEPLKDCIIYKIESKTRMTICSTYEDEDKHNVLYEELTSYDDNNQIIGYVKHDSDDKYIDSYYHIGNLNVGENTLSFMNSDNNSSYIIHITRKDKEEIVPTEEVKDTTIKEDDNIKESPNTGSTINIIIGIFLLTSFSVLLYLDKKHKQVKE